ncbi:MAG: hypothetical protein KBE22_13935 [Candidatus Accumulibacter sp.]|nr:hypothetical protein [Accumulibacter sp.]
MKVIVPTEITTAMLTSSTVAEPASGETAWVSGGTYALGDVRIRTATHRKYSCILAHSGVTTLPEDDLTHWAGIAPTARWAMFDNAVSTDTTSTTSMTVVFQPGFFNAIALYKLTGASISITVKDAPSGSTIYSYSGDLFEPFADWYEWLFYPYKGLTRLILTDIVPYSTAEVTITVTAGTGEPVGIGMVCIGDLRSLISADAIGGAQYGARVEPVDYSYIKTDEYGETRIVKRRATTDLNVSVFLPREDADYAVGVVQDVLATPAAWIATEAAGYAALNVFGIGSGSVEYASHTHAIATITVKGLI